jgi:outer membrane biosynthesis protein TonB
MKNAIETAGAFLRKHVVAIFVATILLVGATFVANWISSTRQTRTPRRTMQFTVVNVRPPEPPKPPPPPPPTITPPKVVDEPQNTRVELKASDIPPPDAPAPSAPAAGPLALAAAGDGPGDAFNLAGNPGGRALTSGGAWGEGSGDGAGIGGGTGNRFAWYYSRVATDIEAAFRKVKKLSSASARVELRVWCDAEGRVSRLQLLNSTGDPGWDEAIQSVVGTRVMRPPSADIPMPMILRLTAKRLQ